MSKVVSPRALAASLVDLWSPAVVGGFDESYVKVAKVRGHFTWHSHEHEDELFFVLEGSLRIEMETETVVLQQGEMYVVPRGVRHLPSADEDCLIMLIERRSTLHTGSESTPMTRTIDEQLQAAARVTA